MTAERWRQIESLFAQAIECPPPERARFLDRVCQGDEELRCELESLLACDAPDQRLVDIPADFDANPAANRNQIPIWQAAESGPTG